MARMFWFDDDNGETVCSDHHGNIRGARTKAQKYANELHITVYINEDEDIVDVATPDDLYDEPEEEVDEIKAHLDGIREKIEATPARSAWDRGVKEYMWELFVSYGLRAEQEGRQAEGSGEFCKWVLDGAENWDRYSEGGCSLIFDLDIAERLCTPSELKRTRNGDLGPNPRESWFGVQSRALRQANYKLTRIFKEVTK